MRRMHRVALATATFTLFSSCIPAFAAPAQAPVSPEIQSLLANPAVASQPFEVLRQLNTTALPTIPAVEQVAPEAIKHAEKLIPELPSELAPSVEAAIEFLTGTGEGESGVAIPESSPDFTQFILPTVSGSCIDGELDSVGSAIAVPGPTVMPSPGAKHGETVFLFTALGTSPLKGAQAMNVHWFNFENGKWGTTPLKYNGVNPQGPATVSGTAPTGSGHVVAVLEGAVTTQDATCHYTPTAALIPVK